MLLAQSLGPRCMPGKASCSPHFSHAPRSIACRDGKMYVPSDSFGGLSPEKKAAQALETLLTFTAAKIVLAQLEGSGRGALAAYNQSGYAVLSSHLQEASLRDPDAWMSELVRRDKGIALRVMEVRAAYASTDFEWDQLQRLSIKAIKDSNLALMRKAAAASLQATTTSSSTEASAATAGVAATAAAVSEQAALPGQQRSETTAAPSADTAQQLQQQQPSQQASETQQAQVLSTEQVPSASQESQGMPRIQQHHNQQGQQRGSTTGDAAAQQQEAAQQREQQPGDCKPGEQQEQQEQQEQGDAAQQEQQ